MSINPSMNKQERINCKHINRKEYLINPMFKNVTCLECGLSVNVATNPTDNPNENIVLGSNHLSSGSNSIAIGSNSVGYAPNTFAPKPKNNNDMNSENYEETLQRRISELEDRISGIKRNETNYRNRLTPRREAAAQSFIQGLNQVTPLGAIGHALNSVGKAVGDVVNVKGFENYFPDEPPKNEYDKALRNTAPLTVGRFLSETFYLHIEDTEFEGVKYYDITFDYPQDQNNPKLDILKKGDVIKWEMVRKGEGVLSYLSPKVKAVKTIRINSEELEKDYKEEYGN